MNFTFQPTDLDGVVVVKCDRFRDHRGSFSEVYREDLFSSHGIGPFVQENYSTSIKNVVRGLHYQAYPQEIGKLVSCPHGIIYDVAVDIRKDSPTFGQWTAAVLDNGDAMLWIPKGFAHGFAVLSDAANVLYRQTGYYSKPEDRAIAYDDPNINIRWPVDDPLISEKDRNASLLKDAELL